MHAEKRILTNTAVLGLGEGIGQLSTFVLVVVCGRVYGAAVLGWYSMGMAVGVLATILVSVGTHSFLIRELAQRPESSAQRIGGTLPYQIALSVLVFAATVGCLLIFVDDPNGRWIIAALVVFQLTVVSSSLLLIAFRAQQIMWPSAVASAVERAAAVAIAVPLILLGAAPGPAFLSFPIVGLVVALAVFAAANKFLGGRIERRPHSLKEQRTLYAAGLPFFGSGAVDVLYSRLGLFMLTLIAGEHSAGIYTGADRLLVIVGVFRILFLTSLYPAVARFAASDRARALELSNRCMRLILVLSIPIAGWMAIFHREIIDLMFGDAFAESAVVLLVLTPLLLIRGVNGLWTKQAAAIDLRRALFRGRVLMLLVFVASGAALIALAGPVGLALALVLAECVYTLVLRGLLTMERFRARVLPVLGKPLIAVLAGGLAYATMNGLALPLRAAGVAAVIGAAIFATGAVRMHDIRYLRSVLKHQPRPAASDPLEI